jgi:high-affinity iron transporter
MAEPCPKSRGVLATLLLALLVSPAAYAAPSDDPHATADIRRSLTLLNVVAEEYREGVVDGRVVLPLEYQEAKTFLDEAQARLRTAAPAAEGATAATFAAARSGIEAKAALDQVRADLDVIRAAIVQQTGVAEEIYPPAAPSADRGRALFADNCASCHGQHADGRGPDAARLNPPPANFTDPAFMRRETPFSFFNIISAGKGTSAMPAWADVFSLQDRWDLVSYLYTVEPGQARLAEGQGVYMANCAGCHGVTGDGHGELSAKLLKQAAPLNTTAAVARKTDEELLATVAHGSPASPMPAFAGRLSDGEIAAVVSYLRMVSLGGPSDASVVAADPDAPRRLAGLLRVLGDQYRKATAPDAAIREQALTATGVLLEQVLRQAPRVRDAWAASDPAAAAALTERLDRIAAAIRDRQPATEVVQLVNPLAQSIEAQFPLAGAETQSSDSDELAQSRRLLEQALAAYRAGDARAVYLVSDAYFLFDPVEKKLALNDAELAQRAEARFAELRGLMGTPGHEREATALVAAIGTDLEDGRRALIPRSSEPYGVAFQSGFIILREGFEVVLILGALLGYVRKAGAPSMRAPILYGAAAGVLASVLTAYALGRIFQASGATAEVVEGATMLLAAAVLFFVSYWLISKAEADRWQRYIQGKVKSALASGNALALGGAAFLAVYREGTETILFYNALIDSASGAITALSVGFAIGVLGLAIVYMLYTRLGSRLPMRQFFFVTGGLLYYLAVVFAGKGVAELQGAGWISTTPVPWMPRVDLIGLYPTAETLAAQGALLLCVVYALLVTMRRARRDVAHGEVPIKVASHGSAKL